VGISKKKISDATSSWNSLGYYNKNSGPTQGDGNCLGFNPLTDLKGKYFIVCLDETYGTIIIEVNGNI